MPPVDDLLGPALQSQSIDVLRSCEAADQNWNVIGSIARIGYFAKQKRAPFTFGQTAKLKPYQRMKLAVFVHDAIDLVEEPPIFERFDVIAKITIVTVVRSHRIHRRLPER